MIMKKRLLTCVTGIVCFLLSPGFSNDLFAQTQFISTSNALARPSNQIVNVSGSTYMDNNGSYEFSYDARGWTINSIEKYPVKVGNNNPGTRQVWVGGEVNGLFPTNLTWREMKNSYDGCGILMRSKHYLVIDGMRIHNVMDGIRPQDNSGVYKIANVYATYIRDDAIESDEMMGGLIEDCLFDGCYMFLSQQGERHWRTDLDSLYITNTLARLEPMPYDYHNSGGRRPQFESLYGINAKRHGALFKHHDPLDAPVIVENCIFYVPQYSVNGIADMNFPTFAGCRYSNNILLWTGGGKYPGKLPAKGVTEYNLINSTREEIDQIWNNAVNEWIIRQGYGVKPHQLRVENGSGDGNYTWKTEVNIQADAPPVDKTFDKWIGDTEYLIDPNSSTTKVIMPLHDITLIATYKIINIIPGPENNAMLSAITWPDAPSIIRELPGWREDTISGFQSGIFSYEITLPESIDNVPVLMAIPEEVNARIVVKRAKFITGPMKDRTTTFTVISEDGTTVKNYTVVFSEVKPEFSADPIITDLFHMRTTYERGIEITNPGNTALDLSNYMIVAGLDSNIEELIKGNSDLYADRFKRYVPGYTYHPANLWELSPNKIIKDFDVNPIIEPGGSFVLARARNYNFFNDNYAIHYDVLITLKSYGLSVNEEKTNTKAYYLDETQNCVTHYRYQGGQLCLFKILNDSIKAGLKPLTDPKDFELIDMVGHWTGETWNPTGTAITNWQHRMERKPQYWKGNPLPGLAGSFAETAEESEWIYNDIPDWAAAAVIMTSGEIGSHSFDPILDNISTVSSIVYKVSKGYTSAQDIIGVPAGTTVSGFLANIVRAHEEQSLQLKGKENDDLLETGDTLIVTSADASAYTEYLISLGSLSSDAVLFAKDGSGYTIAFTGSEGTISGIQFGTSIEDVLNNIIKPTEAILSVLDLNENLVPLQLRNFNEEFVKTKASNRIFFEVIAEDGVSIILYQLILNGSASDAYLYSDLYHVDQNFKLVSYVPQGINVQSLFKYLHPNAGASVKLLNKAGQERMTGDVVSDDQIIVSSADQTVQHVYFIISTLTSLDPRMMEALKIYPNPASDLIYIEGAGINDHLVIKNISGRTVKIVDNEELMSGPVSVGDLSPGIYLIYINNKGIYSRPVKLIKL
jgi:hypothetical protein